MALIVPETEKVQLTGPRGRGSYGTYSRAGIDTSAIKLGEALSQLGGSFTSLAAGQTEAKEAADARNLEHYVGKARQEIVEGVPMQAQLGNILPEQSNVIRGRVAESLGFEQGQKWVQERYSELMSDENLLMNPAAFGAALDKLKAEAYEKAKEDPAYGAGYLKAVDGLANQASSNATQMRTKAMTEAQERQFDRDLIEVHDGKSDLPEVGPQSSNTPGTAKTSVVTYGNKGAARRFPITPTLTNKLDDAVQRVYGVGYRAVVYSGGQDEEGHKKLGSSTRHNHGNAADVHIYGPDGKQVRGDDLAPIAQYWAARKYGGVGLEMKGGGIHLDEHEKPPTGGGMAWNYAAKGGQYTPKQQAAVEAGLKGVLPQLRGEVPVAGSAGSTPVKLAANTVPTGPTGGVGTMTDAASPNTSTDAQPVNPQLAQVEPNSSQSVDPNVTRRQNQYRALDERWAKSGSLAQGQRRLRAVSTLVQAGVDALDPSYIEGIPPEWITPDLAPKVEKAREAIARGQATRLSAQRQAREDERKEFLRSQKNTINQTHASGGTINPAQYANDPEAYDYALKRQQDELYVEPSWSQTNMNSAQTRIEKAALTDNWDDLGFDRAPTREEVDNWVDDLPDMKASDRVKLKEKVPELMEMGTFVGGAEAEKWYDDSMGKYLSFRLSSIDGELSRLTGAGEDIYSVSKTTYQAELREGFKAYVEDNGRIPTGSARRAIYKEALATAKAAANELIAAAGKGGGNQPASPGSNRTQKNTQEPSNTGNIKATTLPNGKVRLED